MCKNFILVHISTSLEVCEKRDVKGLYKKARDGKILDFTGIDSPFEDPENPDITIDTDKIELENAVDIVMNYLRQHFIMEQ